jgi:NADPH:quinone reductase-like Zn-dependent oxidoreductase
MKRMNAARIHKFGSPEVISVETVPKPEPGGAEIVVQIKAAALGPWDAAIRQGKTPRPYSLPLILGAEFCGVVESVGFGVEHFNIGDQVFGVTNEDFIGAHAEYATAKAALTAPKPSSLNDSHAASTPVAAVTAWQMVFEHARLMPGQCVLIHGGGGNVGAFAVQLAKRAGAVVIATASSKDTSYVRGIGADGVIDYRANRFEERVKAVDAVLDTVGGETLERSYQVIKPGGIVVSSVASPTEEKSDRYGILGVSFLVQITAERLKKIGQLIDEGQLKTQVGEVLWLEEIHKGHEMLEGAPHRRGKIVMKLAE